MRRCPRLLLVLLAFAASAAAQTPDVPEGPGLGAERDTLALPPGASVVRLGPGVLPRSARVEALRGDAFAVLPQAAYTLGPDGVLRLAAPADSVVTLIVAYRRLPTLAAVEGRLPLADTLAARDSARAAAPRAGGSAAGLRTTGSISRGVVAGSNRDVSVTSGLRLQLSGEVAPGVDVSAALTDENTPVLPEGTTAQLQDLDRVYVEVAAQRVSARLGDVDLVLPGTAFAPLQRKVQGAAVEASWDGPARGRALASASATRGLFRSQDVVALDGVQGPYRLQGAAAEPFVVVVPGSERVYLDGARVARGEAEDYTIDYATGELTFTPRRLITAERRITVDFEYTTGGFTRTLLAATAEGSGWRDARGRDRLTLGARLFREADAAGFAAELGLSQSDLDAIAAAGDADVLVDGAERVAFDPESPFVLYARRDTVDAAGAPLQIFVPATAETAEVFRVRFSRVAAGRGTYRRGAQLQNGIVYEYVGPGGDYVPFRTLPRPAARTLVDLAGSAEVLPGVELFGEWARSVDDANTLSDLGDADDAGGASELGVRFREARLGGGTLTGELRRRARADRFRPLDRVRDVEFNRRWNLARAGTPFGSVLDTLGEDVTEATLRWARGASAVEAEGGRLTLGGWRADRAGGAVGLDSLGALPRLDARLAVARSTGAGPTAELLGTGRFVRADGTLDKLLGVWRPGVALELERREQETTGARLDTLLSQSYAFVAARPGVAYSRGPLDLTASVEGRWEREPLAPLSAPTAGLPLTPSARAVTVETTAAFDPAGSFQGDARVAVRRKTYEDAFQALGRPDGSSVAIRLSARAAPLGRALDGQAVYEALTERAPVLQETYIRVGPDLGAFVWRDGGGEPRAGEPDGVAQLDEFFPETTPLEGTYLRTFVPSDELFPTVGASLALRLGARPGRLFSAAPDWLRGLATQTTVDLRERTRSSDVARVLLLDPSRLQQRDEAGGTLSGRFRVEQTATLWGDRPRQGLRLALVHASATSRLAAGLDTRLDQSARLDATAPLSARLLVRLEGGLERSRSTSEAFASRTFDLRGVRAEPTLVWTPTAASAVQAGVAVASRTDVLAPAARPSGALVLRLPVEARGTLGERLALTARAEAARVSLRGDGAGGLALFELSEGRGPGTSFLWGGTLQAGLGGGVRASVTYDARAPSGAPLVQTVRATVSAVF